MAQVAKACTDLLGVDVGGVVVQYATPDQPPCFFGLAAQPNRREQKQPDWVQSEGVNFEAKAPLKVVYTGAFPRLFKVIVTLHAGLHFNVEVTLPRRPPLHWEGGKNTKYKTVIRWKPDEAMVLHTHYFCGRIKVFVTPFP